MKKLIHIVDDEAFMRRNIIDALTRKDIEFAESNNGKDAIKELENVNRTCYS